MRRIFHPLAMFGIAWAIFASGDALAERRPSADEDRGSKDEARKGRKEGAVLPPGKSRDRVSREETPGGPLETFAAVERAWSHAAPESLAATLDPDEKIHLAFANGGPRGGWYNRDQAYFLLKDMLEFTKTVRFEFQKYWNLDASGRSPYAVATREFRMNDGAKHTDQVYIALRKRGDEWFVGEIRSLEP